jgi:uncharacterized coiled-coil protein SlyX
MVNKKDAPVTRAELNFVFNYVKNLEVQFSIVLKNVNKMTDIVKEYRDKFEQLNTQIEALTELFKGFNSKASDDSKSKKYIR